MYRESDLSPKSETLYMVVIHVQRNRSKPQTPNHIHVFTKKQMDLIFHSSTYNGETHANLN